MALDELRVVRDMEEIKGDVKTILIKLEFLLKATEDQERRLRVVEGTCSESKTKLGSIIAIASVAGGIITTLLGVLAQYVLK